MLVRCLTLMRVTGSPLGVTLPLRDPPGLTRCVLVCTPVLRKSLCALGSYDLETQQLVKPNLQQRKSERFSCSVSWSGLFGLFVIFLISWKMELQIGNLECSDSHVFDIHKGYVNGLLYK